MKKSILVLTALSAADSNVAEAAQILAGKLHKNLILLNCDDVLSPVLYYPALPVMKDSYLWKEERKAKLNQLTDHIEHRFSAIYPGQKLQIQSLIMEGAVDLNVKKILKEHPVEMIVMGASSGSSSEHFLFGSDTASIIYDSNIPVLIIPSKWIASPLRQITFATKLMDQDIDALNYLLTLRQHLEGRLEIVHVRKYKQQELSQFSQMIKFIEKHIGTNTPMISYHTVYGKHVIPRLNRYCNENRSEVLALSREHHSFLFRLLKEGTVEKYLSGHKIPLLIVPQLKTKKVHAATSKTLSGIVL